MTFEQYEFSVDSLFLNYEFESVGPKGKIKKAIRFSPKNVNGSTYFNLGFGDVDERTRRVDDFVITDNQERNKVLATVAATVLVFLKEFPDMAVYAKGNTDVKTRLYQMSIAANWDIIDADLEVFGYVGGLWQPFEMNVNYEAFLVVRKNI